MKDENTQTNNQPPEFSGVSYDFDLFFNGDAVDGVNINHFYVDPDRRRQSLGTTTLDTLITHFTETYPSLEYVVVNAKGGVGMKRLLSALGFKIIEDHSDRDGHITGELSVTQSQSN